MSLQSVEKLWLGVWKNSKGSLMEIEDVDVVQAVSLDKTEHYRVLGTYRTAKGAVPSAIKFPLCGFVVDDQIVFSVSFRFPSANPPVSSATSWTGQVLPDDDDPTRQVLKTLWHLTRDISEGNPEEENGWALCIGGADTFTKQT